MNVRAQLYRLMLILTLVISACGGSLSTTASEPTAMATPTADPRQAAKIVQAFWDALESGNLDVALVYLAEDASCAGNCYFTGKTTFRSYLQGYLEAGYVTKISDVKNVGGIVTYSWQVYRNGNFVQAGDSDEIMHVEEGQIIYWENQHR